MDKIKQWGWVSRQKKEKKEEKKSCERNSCNWNLKEIGFYYKFKSGCLLHINVKEIRKKTLEFFFLQINSFCFAIVFFHLFLSFQKPVQVFYLFIYFLFFCFVDWTVFFFFIDFILFLYKFQICVKWTATVQQYDLGRERRKKKQREI